MNNLFVTNPIKVNIISCTSMNKIFVNKMIVFIGKVPKKVEVDILKLGNFIDKEFLRNKNEKDCDKILINKTKKKFPNIKKFYGKNWLERLGISNMFCATIKGGNSSINFESKLEDEKLTEEHLEDENIDFNFDTPIIGSTDNNIINDDVLTGVTSSPSDDVGLTDGSLTDLTSHKEEEEEEEILESSIEHIFKDRKTKKVKYSLGKTKIQWIFDELKIFPFDKISEFKQKIFSVTGIEPYRQHLWCTDGKQNYSLSYNIMKSDIPVYEPISDFLEKYSSLQTNTKNKIKHIEGIPSIKHIEGIPINIEYYNNKNSLKIEAYDNFKLLRTYYSKYGVTSYNLVDINTFIINKREKLWEIFKNDEYQKDLFYFSFIYLYWPMITLEVFTVYIKHRTKWIEYFPELHPNISNLKKKFVKEYDITDQYDILNEEKNKKKRKLIENQTRISITASIISILKVKDSKEPTINLRNIFDYFDLDQYVDFCKCIILYNGKKIIMKKAFNKNPLATNEQIFSVFHPAYNKIVLNSILFRIRINPKKTTQSLYLNLFHNGNYIIMASWQEDLEYGFDEIYSVTESLINPVIKKINNMGLKVLYYEDDKLCLMNKKIAKFTEISFSIIWNSTISNNQFSLITDIINEFIEAGILKTVLGTDINILEYYFSKGMHCFDPLRIEKSAIIKNYYEYLSNGIIQQKWNIIFNKTRITKIQHRLNSVKIEIIGVQIPEYEIFLMYMNILFYLYMNKCSKLKQGCEARTTKMEKYSSFDERIKRKTLTDNKHQDPELYNSKKLYKTDFIYSRICQKPYQPIILSMEEYNDPNYLSKEQKSRAVKFWNFTNQIPVYYLSINPKYKYIKFTTNKHPKNYCIPCSKKTPVVKNKNDLKRIIHETCLKDHIWTQEKKTITEKSRYIMSYGKDIEINRLSRLPEKSLEPLFFDTYSTAGELDRECVIGSEVGYYLYGIQQNLPNISKIGYIFCLSHALGYTIEKLLEECKKRIKYNSDKFKILLNGHIYSYFSSYKELISTIDVILKGGILSRLELTQMGDVWNDLFESIAFIYFAINTIRFEDKSKKSEISDSNIELILPPRLHDSDTFIHTTHKNLLILKKLHNNIYYPIYNINTELFYKTKIIDVKLFSSKSEIIQILQKIIISKFKNIDIENINLSILIQFIKSNHNNNEWDIEHLFINKNNYCYYVELIRKNKKDTIYVPVKLSFYSSQKKVIYEPLNEKKHRSSIKILNTFITSINRWIAKKSEAAGFINYDIPKSKPLEQRVQPIVPYIKLNKWILISDTKSLKTPFVIGFTSGDLIFYINNISIKTAKKLADVPFNLKRNNPYKVNNLIYKYSTHKINKYKNNKQTKLNKAIYKHYLYNLFLLEFITMFNKKKNTALRSKIKILIVKTNFTNDIDELGDELKKIIIDTKDMHIISLYISNYLHKHHDKKKLLESINLTKFNFDIALLEKYKELGKNALKTELNKLSKKIICPGIPKYTKFNNILIPCNSPGINRGYCSHKKLIVPKNKLKDYIDILASDILNPIKSKWIFSSIFIRKIITYFKFIKRPFEKITIILE